MTERDINQNVTPDPLEGFKLDLFPHPLTLATHGVARAVKAVGLFLRDRHSIPYSEAVPERGADLMLLGEENGTRPD